jgi:hypothetical protein
VPTLSDTGGAEDAGALARWRCAGAVFYRAAVSGVSGVSAERQLFNICPHSVFFHGSSFSAETAETFSSPPPIAKKKIYVRRAAVVDTVCFVSSSDFLDAYRIAIDDAKVDAKALAAAMRNKGFTKAQARINGASLKAFADIRLKQGGA